MHTYRLSHGSILYSKEPLLQSFKIRQLGLLCWLSGSTPAIGKRCVSGVPLVLLLYTSALPTIDRLFWLTTVYVSLLAISEVDDGQFGLTSSQHWSRRTPLFFVGICSLLSRYSTVS